MKSFLIFLLFVFPFSASAANTLTIFLPKSSGFANIGSYSINAGTDVDAVYCDPPYFYTGETKNLKQYMLKDNVVYQTSAAVDLSLTADPNIVSINGLTGDGTFLYVAVTTAVGDPLQALKTVYKIDKNGHLLHDYTATHQGGVQTAFLDITLLPTLIATSRLTTVPTNVIEFYSIDGDKLITFFNTSRLVNALTWIDDFLDGIQSGAAGNALTINPANGNFITASVATNVVATGLSRCAGTPYLYAASQ